MLTPPENILVKHPRQKRSEHIIIMVWDGMRPDLVSCKNTPNLLKFAQSGVTFADNHSCFPTLTRLNSASISTGAYPTTHGLMGNNILVTELAPYRGISTGDYHNLLAFNQVTNHQLLTTDSIAHIVAKSGGTVATATSCSTGAAFLLNHQQDGLIVNHSYVLPESSSIIKQFGSAPEADHPNIGRNTYAIDVLTKYILPEIKPNLTYVWLSDPDYTQHHYGLGSVKNMEAIRHMDDNLGRILSTVKSLTMETDIFVLSDHGFVTHEQPVKITQKLVEAGLKTSEKSTDVICVDTHIYVEDNDADRIHQIVRFLQGETWCGPIFTRHSESSDQKYGHADGTLSLQLIGNDHPRAGDILYAYDWSCQTNANGIRGTSTGGSRCGHGSISPFELRTMLFANGPSLKSGLVSQVPSGNIDVGLTALHLLGIEPTGGHDGRILCEALTNGPNPEEIYFTKETIWAERENGTSPLKEIVQRSHVEDTWYLDKGAVFR